MPQLYKCGGGGGVQHNADREEEEKGEYDLESSCSKGGIEIRYFNKKGANERQNAEFLKDTKLQTTQLLISSAYITG